MVLSVWTARDKASCVLYSWSNLGTRCPVYIYQTSHTSNKTPVSNPGSSTHSHTHTIHTQYTHTQYTHTHTQYTHTHIVPRPHLSQGKGSGDNSAISWLFWVNSLDFGQANEIEPRHPSMQSMFAQNHNQEIAQLSPDPFPCERWGLGMRLVRTNAWDLVHGFYIDRTMLQKWLLKLHASQLYTSSNSMNYSHSPYQ